MWTFEDPLLTKLSPIVWDFSLFHFKLLIREHLLISEKKTKNLRLSSINLSAGTSNNVFYTVLDLLFILTVCNLAGDFIHLFVDLQFIDSADPSFFFYFFISYLPTSCSKDKNQSIMYFCTLYCSSNLHLKNSTSLFCNLWIASK